MDFRKTFDAIPEQFDKWRPRYCDELFAAVIDYAKIDASKYVLEIGLGTGQATEPFLKTGCDYLAIELGEHFVEFTKNKFDSYNNFNIVSDDFEIYDFGNQKFDLVFSAATIQWIPEKICFPKVYNLLKSGGTLAMFMSCTDEKTPNEALYDAIQKVYDKYFHVETKYTCKLNYDNVVNYGFVDYNYRDWKRKRVYTAEEYIEYLASTQVEHITLQEPYKSSFYSGVRESIINAGNKITLNDTIALYLAKKPGTIIGKIVTVTVDRPLGSYHPEHKDMYYPINYGYIEGVMAPDGEEQDAYILGIEEAVESFTGKIIAIVHRNDDIEEKWVVCPENMSYTKDEIQKKVHFQEQYFSSHISME